MADKTLPFVERLEAIAASSSGLIAVGGRRDVKGAPCSVHVARLPKMEHVASLEVGEPTLALAFVGDVLCAGDASGNLHLWDTSGEAPAGLSSDGDRHQGAIRALLAFDDKLATVGDDGILKLSTVGPGGVSSTSEVTLSKRALRALAVSDDLATIAAGGDDGMVRSLAASLEGEPREMNMDAGVGAIAFLGDGRVAAGCADGSVRIAFLEGAAEATDRAKDAAHTAPVRALFHTAALTDAAKRALPRRLLSVSEDGDIKAWQVDTRRKPPTITVSKGALTGAVLIAGSSRAKAEKRGGSLIISSRNRSISVLTVDEEGKPSDSIATRVRSLFAELAEHLKSKKDEVRVEACSTLTKIPEDQARKSLDRVLAKDKSTAVRRAAAYAIGASDRRLSRAALREALGDSDKDVREAVLRALEKIERDAPIAAARAALESRHPDMRIKAVGKLPALREQSPLVPTLVAKALSDGDAKVRTAALDALYSLETGQPLRAARVALTRGPADIRREVLIRIGRARTALLPDGAELIEGALDDPDEAVRTAAFLTSIAARASLIAKVRSVDAHTKKAVSDIESRGAFADASDAASTLSEEDRRPLYAAMACRFPDTALRAARLLALIGDPRATGALLQLSRESDPAMRRYVVEALLSAALAMPTDGRVTDRLRWLVDDPDESVRQAAFDSVQFLAELAGASGEIDLAALALRASSADIRVRALPVLVKFGGTGQYASIADLASQADELLSDALDDEHDKVRGEAFRTLWAWHSSDPRTVLERAAGCRQPEVRRRVIKELPHQKPATNAWADELLLALVADHVAEVGLDAYAAATKPEGGKARVDVHLQAMRSTSPQVRVRGLKGAPRSGAAELTSRIVELVRDEKPDVHIAAIEALDRLDPKSAEGFAAAFGSIFYALRVRAMELCGRRQDDRCVKPARDLLAIPDTHLNRPSDELRQRAAAALADVGSRALLDYYSTLTVDADPIVREMASRGLATACAPGDESALVAVLGHEDLPVRSWIAEGLARLGDDRALPVLAGTLSHNHLPIRRGAIMGFVALGPDGVRGILKGLDDSEHREIQDLVFAVIVARDLALTRAGEAPDLLLSALSAVHPEIRYAAARILETRGSDDHEGLTDGLVGPTIPEKASETKDWPEPSERTRRLTALVDALASDHPLHRYAATQVLSLRAQPKAFWREAKTLLGPSSRTRPRIPFTSWDSEEKTPRKRGWIRSLVGGTASSSTSAATTETERLLETFGITGTPSSDGGALEDAALAELVFGTYAGLVRQAPSGGDADETHRVRRDAIDRLAAIAANAAVGREAVLPVLRRALSDPHHMVRRKAVAAVRSLYESNSLEPLRLELSSAADDVGRGAVDALVDRAGESDDAMALAKDTINAPVSAVRRYALSRLPQLFESGSLEPWLLALDSRYADIRLNVVDRLVDSTDERVLIALARAMESDHEDLRLKAASALAARGDARTVDVLAGLLLSDDSQWDAIEALVELAHARPNRETSAAATRALVGRLENDPDETADREELLDAIERIASSAAADFLCGAILREGDEAKDSPQELLRILVACLRDAQATPKKDTDGVAMIEFEDIDATTAYAARLVAAKDSSIRGSAVKRLLKTLPGREAEELIEGLLGDRVEEVRVAACMVLAYRARNIEGASIGALSSALREGRRELVLPAAEGLASRGSNEAFQPLLLVFKAGEQAERKRAVMAMGALGDERVLEELEPFVEGSGELEPEDAELLPAIIESFGRMSATLEGDPAERVRALVENMAREGSDELRKSAIKGLRRGGDERARVFIESIAGDALEIQSIRNNAILQLGELASAESESVLADIIREGDYSTGSAALTALQKIFPGERTRTELLALTSSDGNLSGPAASFLSWFGDIDTLVERLTSVADVGIRTRLRQGLIRRGACPTAELVELLSSDDAGDRADASWIVGAATIGDGEPDSSLTPLLEAAIAKAPGAYRDALARRSERAEAGEDERAAEAWVAGLWAAHRLGASATSAATEAIGDAKAPKRARVMAARYLAAAGDESQLGLLESMLGDREPEIRSAAADGIANLSPSRASSMISDSLVADSAAIRPMVSAALEGGADLLGEDKTRRLVLGQMIGQKRLDELATAAKESGTGVKRLAAIAALGRLGGSGAEDVLSTLLDEGAGEADEVRAQAYRALRRLQRSAERAQIGGES